jgi:dephospho-CoA kinase
LNGHGTVDDGLHEHHRAKRPGLDVQRLGAQRLDDVEIESLRVCGIGGPVERRSPAPADVAEERELRNHQQRSANVDDGQRHLALVIRKYTQPGDLVGDILDVPRLVAARCAEIDEQPPINRADRLAVDRDAGFVDALNDGSHARRSSTGQIVLPERSDDEYSRAMKPVVGLTGGIASGKTTVAEMFAKMGIPIIDADDLAREVVEPGTPGLQAIVDEFGEDVLDEEGRLDRKKVGELVFGDEEARETLNAILHPRIGAAGAKYIQGYADHPAPYVIYEGALLVETGAYKAFSALIVVSADESVQRLRLIARDGYTVSQANARIESQLPLARKVAVADHVVTNNGNLESTREQVARVHEQLVARFGSGESA